MSETGRCRDCRWWQTGEEDPDHQRSEDVAVGRGWGLCQFTLSVLNQPKMSNTRAFASNDGYELDEDQDYAALVTAPDFGCVQWEAREP